MSVEIGLKGRAETVVTEENVAGAVGSGLAPVFATPCMIALMEQAAAGAVQPCLGPGESSVGTHLDVSHDAATPIGMRVWAEAELTAVQGRRLSFAVTAYDEAGVIGRGVHQRAIVQGDKFLARVQAKLDAARGRQDP